MGMDAVVQWTLQVPLEYATSEQRARAMGKDLGGGGGRLRNLLNPR